MSELTYFVEYRVPDLSPELHRAGPWEITVASQQLKDIAGYEGVCNVQLVLNRLIKLPRHDVNTDDKSTVPRCHRCRQLAGSTPTGECWSEPPIVFAVIAPDGRISCATLRENALAKMMDPDWKDSVIVEYRPQVPA